MTGVDAPPGAFDVTVSLDGRWLELPVQQQMSSEKQIGDWAAELVAQGLAARAAEQSPYRRMVLEQLYAASLEGVRSLCDEERQVLVSACLAPADDLLPVVTVNVSAVSLAAGMPDDAVVELLVLPEEQRYAEPDVEELETGAGRCTRVRQLVLGDGAEESSVATSLQYVWPTAHDGVYLLLDAYFSSPAEAALYEPDVDAVAQSMAVQSGS